MTWTFSTRMILPLLALPGLAAALVLLVRIRREPGQADEPRCGRCGYIVRGISALMCPECGSDLLKAGIIPPGERHGRGLFTRCILWSIAVGLAAPIANFRLQQWIMPYTYVQFVNRTIFIYAGDRGLDVHAETRGYTTCWTIWRNVGMLPPSQLVLKQPRSNSLYLTMYVDLASRDYTYTDLTGRTIHRPGGFDAAVIREWLAAGQARLPDGRDYAQDILTLVDEMPRTLNQQTVLALQPNSIPQVMGSQSYAFTGQMLAIWTLPLMPLLWLTIWWLGLRRIRRPYRQSITAAQSLVGGAA